MTQYLGYEVLPIEPDGADMETESVARGVRILTSPTGRQAGDQHAAAPAPLRPFTWKALGDSEIAELLAFIDRRRGRAVPFWLPSYHADLVMSQDLANGSTALRVRWCGYVASMFPSGNARRHLALLQPGADLAFHRVAGAVDPGRGQPEQLTLSPAAGRSWSASRTTVSFLKFVRFEEDLVRVEYLARGIAQATIQVRELFQEAPGG